MTLWCLECAQKAQHQAATRKIDGDPLCEFHATQAAASVGVYEEVRLREPEAQPKKKRGRPKGSHTKKAHVEPEASDPEPPKREPEAKAGNPADTHRVLWKTCLQIGNRNDEFLFRAGEDFGAAFRIALHLLDSSASCQMEGAVIVALERIARLWN